VSRSRKLIAFAAPLACAGCAMHNAQNALLPAGPQAGREAGLYWFMLPIAVIVWALVVIVLLWGAGRRRAARPVDFGHTEVIRPDQATSRRLTRSVVGAVAATVVILFVVLVADFRVGQALTIPAAAKVVPIQVTGHQYWWELTYPDSIPQNNVTTANEMHVPVGRPVVVTLESRDVIHSFWVPNLAGKKDLLPGYTRSLWFRADTPGVYRGQCAEFCGYQHAKMGMLVIAESQEKYDAWIKAQQSAANAPQDSATERGKIVFEGSTCVMCHAISGTVAGATMGPDLTHLASRQTIAAGTLPNTEANLYAWISDPQRIKPGTLMPATKLDPRDLHALVAYLRQLK
jgi:cytochrome c oxidase subunit 2